MTNSSPHATKDVHTSDAAISPWRMGLLATACGLLAANVYYSQPIAGSIAVSLGLTPAKTGLIIAMTQAGFGVGLLLIVRLSDLIENRRLVLMLIGVSAIALLGSALSMSPLPCLSSAIRPQRCCGAGLGTWILRDALPIFILDCTTPVKYRR